MNEQYDDLDELPAPPRKDIPEADRELLELAACALGARFAEVDGEGYGNLHFEDGSVVYAWNSLMFSGDALELAVKLRIDILQRGTWEEAQAVGPMTMVCSQLWGDDPLSATCHAVTRAAAEIGKALPGNPA